MCGLEVPDLINAIRQNFTEDQVLIALVNKADEPTAVLHFAEAVGITEPMLLDLPGLSSTCWQIPENDSSLYNHVDARIPRTMYDPPFPIQYASDGNGEIAFMSRMHQPDVLVEILHELVDEGL